MPRGRVPIQPITKVCAACGKSFEAGGRGRPPISRRYCSRACLGAARRVPIATRTCPVCARVFTPAGSGARIRGRTYCSRTCAGLGRIKPSHIPTLTVAQAAYLAGLVDGEGSIVTTRRAGGHSREWLRVMVTNTSQPVLDWLTTNVGGRISAKQPNATFVSRVPCFTWAVNGASAVDVLQQILPYLVIKRERAVAGIATQPHQT